MHKNLKWIVYYHYLHDVAIASFLSEEDAIRHVNFARQIEMYKLGTFSIEQGFDGSN